MKKIGNKPLTIEPRRIDAVVLAVYVLGGDSKSIDTEEAAVRVHELAPGMFSWQKYPDQINLELVRVTLSDAKKPKYGALLSGSGREGWRLTREGFEWASSHGRELLREGLHWNADGRTAGSVDTVRKRREKARIVATTAWNHWKNGEPLSARQAWDVFRINEYSTGKMLEIKVVRLQSLFEDDADVSCFLKEASSLVLKTGESR